MLYLVDMLTVQEGAAVRGPVRASSMIMSLALSAIMLTAAWVLPETIAGITEASTTLNSAPLVQRRPRPHGDRAHRMEDRRDPGLDPFQESFVALRREFGPRPKLLLDLPLDRLEPAYLPCPVEACHDSSTVPFGRKVVCQYRRRGQGIGRRQPDRAPAFRTYGADRDREPRKPMEALGGVVA